MSTGLYKNRITMHLGHLQNYTMEKSFIITDSNTSS